MGHPVRVIAAFSILRDPEGRTFTPGEIVDSDDWRVKLGGPDKVETIEAHVSGRARASVEQATAAPGEKRSVSKPPVKSAASKPKD